MGNLELSYIVSESELCTTTLGKCLVFYFGKINMHCDLLPSRRSKALFMNWTLMFQSVLSSQVTPGGKQVVNQQEDGTPLGVFLQ
jgi:hypothetical protein